MDDRVRSAASVLKINLRPEAERTVCVGVGILDENGKPAYVRETGLLADAAAELVEQIVSARGTTEIELLPFELTGNPEDALWPAGLREALCEELTARRIGPRPLCPHCGSNHDPSVACPNRKAWGDG